MQQSSRMRMVRATRVASRMSSQKSTLFSALYWVCKGVRVY